MFASIPNCQPRLGVRPNENRQCAGPAPGRCARVVTRSVHSSFQALHENLDAATTAAASDLILRALMPVPPDNGILATLSNAVHGTTAFLSHTHTGVQPFVFDSSLLEAWHHAPTVPDLSHTLHDAVSTSTAVVADIGTSPAAQEAMVAAAAHAVDASSVTLSALSAWTLDRMAVLQDYDPAGHDMLKSSIQDMLAALHQVTAMHAQAETAHWMNALVVGVQQLVLGVRLSDANAANIGTIVAAQEAMAAAPVASAVTAAAAATSAAAVDIPAGLTQLVMLILGMLVAALPRPGWQPSSAASTGSASASRLPNRYDPKAIEAYYSDKPVQCISRTLQVLTLATTFTTTILVDYHTGKWLERIEDRAQWVRNIMEDLGPAYIKMAQQLSTRTDVIPEAYLVQLRRLQDNVRTFSTVEAREVLETGLRQPVDAVFEWLSEEPLAAASLGQVYRGKLRPECGGYEVAVKVQRPGVLETCALDIHVLRRAALLLSKVPGMSGEWAGALDDWAVRFFEELDYELEASNTITFKKNMERLEGIRVATVIPEYTSRKIIVTEWVEGMKLSKASSEQIRSLCSTLLNCYLIQLLETGLLHADPHPGNLLLDPQGKIVILDFGLMTEVSEEQRISLVEFISHLMMEDWNAVAMDLESLGFLPDGPLPPGAEKHIAPVMEGLLGSLTRGGGLGSFNVAGMASQLHGVAMDFKLCVPPYFALLLRAFCVIEGIALSCDNKYAIVPECLPYLSRRLLTDNNPRMRAALRKLLYGDSNRIDIDRLQKMVAAFSKFTTASNNPVANGPTFSSAVMLSERVKGQAVPEEGPVFNEATKEVLKVVFAKDGSYAQELIVEELVAAIDAMSREALGEALRLVMTSASTVTALRSMEALGPLRSMLLPLPLPMEMLSSMQPAVALTSEDRQALATIRTLLDLLQPSINQLPSLAQSGSRALRGAAELVPLVPELLPGMRTTAELLIRQLVRRMALRLADDLEPGRAAAAANHHPSNYPTLRSQGQAPTPGPSPSTRRA